MTRDLSALFDPRSVAVVGASSVPGSGATCSPTARSGARGGARSTSSTAAAARSSAGRRTRRSRSCPRRPSSSSSPCRPRASRRPSTTRSPPGAKALVAHQRRARRDGRRGRARERGDRRARPRRRRRPRRAELPRRLRRRAPSSSSARRTSCPGSIGLISQSGNLALEVGLLAAEFGLGFSRFVSLGNQADVEARELVESFAAHEPTKLIAVYLEDFRDGRAFARAACARRGSRSCSSPAARPRPAPAPRARTPARSPATSRPIRAACLSPPGSSSSPRRRRSSTSPRRSSGAAAGEADRARRGRRRAHRRRLRPRRRRRASSCPRSPDATRAQLAEALPPTATLVNPVDFAGGGEQDISSFAKVVTARCSSPARSTPSSSPATSAATRSTRRSSRPREVESAEGMARAAAETGVPFLAHTMYWRSEPAEMLRENGVPVFREVEAAVGVAGRLARRDARGAPAACPSCRSRRRRSKASRTTSPRARCSPPPASPLPLPGASPAQRKPSPPPEIGYPVVLKALGELHKSDSGGRRRRAPRPRGAERRARARCRRPSIRPRTPSRRWRRSPPGLELIVGAKRDPRFGPILLVGAGGLYAEIVKDVAVALAPVTEAAAEALLRSLRVAPLLDGARGRPAVNVAAAAAAAAALSRVAAEHPEIAEIEINPLLATARRRAGARCPYRPRLMLAEGTFDGKVAIVTGGGCGLGRAIALELGASAPRSRWPGGGPSRSRRPSRS